MRILKEWQFVRNLSLDLLQVLSPEQLEYSPNTSVGPFWKQFRHLGRVEENYTDGLINLKVEFSEIGSSYDGGASVDNLVGYLNGQDEKLIEAVNKFDHKNSIDWFGEPCDIETHLIRLISHETLHHGQLIIYAKSSDINFPTSWEAWGL